MLCSACPLTSPTSSSCHLLDSIHIGPLWGFHVSHMQDTAQRALLLFNGFPPLPPPRPFLKYHLLWTALDDNPVCTHHYYWMLSHLFHNIHPTITSIYCFVSLLLFWFPHWTAGFRRAASLSMPGTVIVTQQGLNRYLLNESRNVQIQGIHMMTIFKSSHLPWFFHNIITFPVSKLSQVSLCPENNNFTVHTKDYSLWESLGSIDWELEAESANVTQSTHLYLRTAGRQKIPSGRWCSKLLLFGWTLGNPMKETDSAPLSRYNKYYLCAMNGILIEMDKVFCSECNWFLKKK